MIRLANIAALAVVVAAGVGLYQLKYNTERVQEEVRALKSQITADEAAIKVLRAEWTYLARPERLEALGNRYLALRPTQAGQIIGSVEDVPLRDNPAAVVAQADDFRAVQVTPARAPALRPAPTPTPAPAPDREEAEERYLEVRHDPDNDLLVRINTTLTERQHD